MQKVSEKDLNIMKGIAIVMIILYNLFSLNMGILDEYHCTNILFPISMTKMIGSFCSAGIAMAIFLCGFELAGYYTPELLAEKKQIGCAGVKAYKNLISAFFVVYILTAATSFLGRDINTVYGTGVKKWVYAAADVLGLQWMLGTPTLNPTWSYVGALVVYIFIMPFLLTAYRRHGAVICLLAVFAPYILKTDSLFWNYLGVLVVGAWCAEERILERLKAYIYKGHETRTMYVKLLGCYAIFLAAGYVKQNVGFDRIMNCVLVLGVVYFSYEFISDVKAIGNVFAVLGTYSFYMWLVHDMLYRYYFTEQIYALRYTIAIFAAVLLMSLMISVFLKPGGGITQNIHLPEKAEYRVDDAEESDRTIRHQYAKKYWYIPVIHCLIGAVYLIVNFMVNDGSPLNLKEINSVVSIGFERGLTLILSIVMGCILICGFWLIVLTIYVKWKRLAGRKLFLGILLAGLTVILLAYPGMYAYEVDNYITYLKSWGSAPFYWHNVYTGYFFSACRMFLPHPVSIPIVQFLCFLLVMAYIYHMAKICNTKGTGYLLLFLLPETLYVALNPYRNCLYTILCLFLLAYVYFEQKRSGQATPKKIGVLIIIFAFTAVWRSEGIIFSIILFFGLLLIVYRHPMKKVILDMCLLLVCIKAVAFPQDLGSEKYWGSDYTMINFMNSIQDILTDADTDLSYPGAADDMEAIGKIVPVEMVKESGVWGYRNYNRSMGRDINQSCAAEEDQKAFLKGYMRLAFYNLPVFLKAKWQDYKTVLFQEYPKSVSYYDGDFFVFPNGESNQMENSGFQKIYHSPGTSAWERNPVRNAWLFILDRIVYAYYWLISEFKIAVCVRLGFYVAFLFCISMDFLGGIIHKSRERLYRFLIEAAIFLEYCAIILVMPEPRAAYFYPMMYCIFFMVLTEVAKRSARIIPEK